MTRSRAAVAGVLVVVLVSALGFLAVGDVLAATDSSSTGHDQLFTDFGSPQLRVTNDGTPLRVLDNGGNASGLEVSDSALTHGAPVTGDAAGYLEAQMTAPVTRIGAIAAFHSDNSGAVGLLTWTNSLVAARAKQPPDPVPNGGIHFAANNRTWHIGVWDSAAQNEHVLLAGPLALATDGTRYAFNIARDGDTVTIRLPDGTMQAARDPRIAEWSGPWACWELYEYDTAQVPATLTAIWAG